MKAIQYKSTTARRPSPTMPRTGAVELKEEEPELGPINGQTAGSSYEWNIARALWKLGWTFEYQVPIRGGRQVRGGQVIDFLVDTVPQVTALRVQGSYWHRDSDLEQLKADDIGRYLGQPVTVLDAFNADCDTYEAAYSFCYRHFGRA